jgi:hypothetical protein
MGKKKIYSPLKLPASKILILLTISLLLVVGAYQPAWADGGGQPTQTDTPEPTDTPFPTETPVLLIIPTDAPPAATPTLDSTGEAFLEQIEESAPLPPSATPVPTTTTNGGMNRFLIGAIVVAVVAVVALISYGLYRRTRGG